MLRPSFTEARSRRTSIQGKDRLPNGHMSTAPDLRIGKHEKANGAIPKHLSMGGAHASNGPGGRNCKPDRQRSEEHTSALQSLMRTSYDVLCLKNKQTTPYNNDTIDATF